MYEILSFLKQLEDVIHTMQKFVNVYLKVKKLINIYVGQLADPDWFKALHMTSLKWAIKTGYVSLK